MSKVLFSELPRFDQAERVFGLSAEDLSASQSRRRPALVDVDGATKLRPVNVQTLETPQQAAPPPEPIADTPVVVAESQAAIAEDTSSPTDIPTISLEDEVNTALDHALLIFEAGLEDMQAKIQKQAISVALDTMSSLMPRLSEQFLADELAEYLPDLLPSNVAEVDLMTSPRMAEALRDILETRDLSDVTYNIHPTENLQDGRLEVSWKTGGLSSDFTSRLEACLTDLGARARNNEE